MEPQGGGWKIYHTLRKGGVWEEEETRKSESTCRPRPPSGGRERRAREPSNPPVVGGLGVKARQTQEEGVTTLTLFMATELGRVPLEAKGEGVVPPLPPGLGVTGTHPSPGRLRGHGNPHHTGADLLAHTITAYTRDRVVTEEAGRVVTDPRRPEYIGAVRPTNNTGELSGVYHALKRADELIQLS